MRVVCINNLLLQRLAKYFALDVYRLDINSKTPQSFHKNSDWPLVLNIIVYAPCCDVFRPTFVLVVCGESVRAFNLQNYWMTIFVLHL